MIPVCSRSSISFRSLPEELAVALRELKYRDHTRVTHNTSFLRSWLHCISGNHHHYSMVSRPRIGRFEAKYGPSCPDVIISYSWSSSGHSEPLPSLLFPAPTSSRAPGQTPKSKCQRILTMTRLNSRYAIGFPAYEREPVEKGTKALCGLDAVSVASQRSGRNENESGKYFSLW